MYIDPLSLLVIPWKIEVEFKVKREAILWYSPKIDIELLISRKQQANIVHKGNFGINVNTSLVMKKCVLLINIKTYVYCF